MRINVVNMTKRNSLYQQGMPVQVLSIKKARDAGVSWQFGGRNLKYGISKLMSKQRDTQEENPRRRIYY